MQVIIHTLPRRLVSSHESVRWQIIKDEKGFFAREWFDINKLTPEERIAYDSTPEPPEFASEMHSDMDAFYESQIPRFPTQELAIKFAFLMDERDNVYDEMHAFHAPSECADIVYRSIDERESLLLMQAV